MAIMSDFQPEGQWFKPGLCRRAVFLGPLDMSPVPGWRDEFCRGDEIVYVIQAQKY